MSCPRMCLFVRQSVSLSLTRSLTSVSVPCGENKKNIDVIPSTSQGFVSEAERRLSLQCIVPAFANLATDTLPPRNPFGRFAGIQLVA